MKDMSRTRNVVVGVVVVALAVVVVPLASRWVVSAATVQRDVSESVYAIPAALNAMGAALIAGDERGWLDVLDPTNPELQQQFHRYYTALRDAGISAWYIGVDPQQLLSERSRPESTMRVWVVYCVRGTGCGSATAGQLDGAVWSAARSFAANVRWNLWRGRWRILTFRPDNWSPGAASS